MLRKVSSVLLLIFVIFFGFVGYVSAQENTVNLYLFWSQSCPHCKEEKNFLDDISPDYPNLKVHDYEINKDENWKLLQTIAQVTGIDASGVPVTFIGDDYFVGYASDDTTGVKIIDLVDKYQSAGDPNTLGILINEIQTSGSQLSNEINIKDSNRDEPNNNTDASENIVLPLVGKLDLKKYSLPLITFVIALVDGFNPCAMWVLLFLISLLLGMKDRKKMWVLGLTFIAASAFVYFLFLAAWLNLFIFIGFINIVRLAIGAFAIIIGFVQLRSYWKNKTGACTTVGGEKRKKIFEFTKKVLGEKVFLLSIVGIIILAFMVNLIELVCSAGLPAIYTNLLALTPMPKWQYYLYLAFYILVFMIDDMVVFVIAMKTLKAVGVEGKYARFSKFIGGIIIFIIGVLMIFAPQVLTFS